ncbi:MAG: very short patch repair endonuclease [Bacteroidota bacterium]
MADIFSKKKRSEIMSRVKSKGSLMEVSLMNELTKVEMRFDKHVKELPGIPDIVFRRKKLVVFLDSCFWHGCRWHGDIPSSNRVFWVNKISANKKRDRKVTREYKKMNWTILRFWEHQIKKDKAKIVSQISKVVFEK